MIHDVLLNNKTDAEQLRARLVESVKDGDKLNINLQKVTFTETRTFLSIINTIALTKNCQLKYKDDSEYTPPPLNGVYTHQPNITAPK